MLLCALALLTNVSTAGELQWRSAKKTAPKPVNSATAQKFTRPRTPQPRTDPFVQPAAFDEEGPELASATEGQVSLRSIVVDPEDGTDSARSAQLPTSPSAAAPTGQPESTSTSQPTNVNSQLEEDLLSPFGTTPEQERQTPGRDRLAPDGMTLPDEGETTPRQRLPQEPRGFQGSELPGQPLPDVAPPTAAAIEKEREDSQAACADSLEKLRANTISKVDLNIAVTGTEGEDFPFECSLDEGTWHAGRSWPQTTYLWKAAALCHKPLYFEDEQLERYGHSFAPCFQPLVSGAHFFTRLPVLPYCMGVEPPLECIYALGHYRPGSCAPYMCDPIPISYRGALFQAGAVVGAAAALP
jgi:hypothetical protein